MGYTYKLATYKVKCALKTLQLIETTEDIC